MKPLREVGILGFGGYVPMYRIKDEEIASAWNTQTSGLPIVEKAVPGPDEDVFTMSYEAAKNAIARAKINPNLIRAAFVGTESKPYAVKPTGSMLVTSLGFDNRSLAAEYEFACKAGTEAFQSAIALVGSGMLDYAMAIGADVAQGRPGDELEFTSGAGAAAFIFSKKSKETVAFLEYSVSYVSDTPDFWRRQGQKYPQHAGRFTGEPAYFNHIVSSVKTLFEETGLKPSDFSYAVFHQPNTKFPLRVGEILGFPPEKIKPGLLSPIVGNAYAGIVPLGLSATLEVAKPNERILVASFGSGAGSDAFSFVTQEALEEKKNLAPLVSDYIKRKKYISYATYALYKGKIPR